MIKLLVISISSPPKSGAESIQVGRCLAQLKKKLAVSLLTTSIPTTGWTSKDVDSLKVLEKIKTYTLSGFYNRYIRYLIRIFFPILEHSPDYDFMFPRQWKRAIKIISMKPDIIYSRSQPYSSALMGMKLANYYEVPWIMHLSDPWVGNPYLEEQNLNKQKEWEARCVERADGVSFTTKNAIRYYSKRYPQFENKFFLSQNVYDEEAVSSEPIDFNRKLTFVHTGNFYSRRNPEYLINALVSLNEEDNQLLKDSEFLFAGHSDNYSNELLKNCHLEQIRYLGALSFVESKKVQERAHVLLVIDKPIEQIEDTLFMPSKVLDYMAISKYILAITDQESSTSELVGSGYGVVCGYNSIEKLKIEIKNIVSAFRERNHEFFQTKPPHPNYSSKVNGDILYDRLNKLL